STTFTDSSSNAFAITSSGDAQISTTGPRFGTGSLTLDGNGDYLSTPADSAFAFGTGDYTVECWVYVNSGNGNNGLFTFGAENAGLCVAIVSGSWCMGFAGVSSGGSASVMGNVGTTGTWQHLAVTRSGTYARMFIDGVQLGDVFGSSTDLYSNQLRIGYY
ncbi:MAG: LamG-like jellyroll fold domain-containing protein, partial [Pirellulaceae bacterium]